MIPAAFYAPLKAPDHPTPSGDRTIARAVQTALKKAGFAPDLASDLRIFDKTGDDAVQAALIDKAEAALPGIIQTGRGAGWRIWVTYHNYYKAPDLIGPPVAKALGIPYVQIESTRARKRLSGPWARFADLSERSAHEADGIFYFTHRDAEALRAYGPPDQGLWHLPPFLTLEDLPPPSRRDGSVLIAAMMRPGDKLESYRLIAQTLEHMANLPKITIAGDGAEKANIRAMMAPFGDQITFLGRLDRDAMNAAYARASVFFWPGVNEAIGMVYLEAQARGIPVLAQNRPGLRDTLAPGGTYPEVNAGPSALAKALEQLISTPPEPHRIRDYIAETHLLPAAARTLRSHLRPLLGEAAA